MTLDGRYHAAATIGVFVSHVHEDSERCTPLLTALDAWGLNRWIDQRDMRAGDPITATVLDAIQARDYFIRVISVNMRRRQGWVDRETTHFVGLRAQDPPGIRKRVLINLLLDPDSRQERELGEFKAIHAYAQTPREWLAELRIAFGLEIGVPYELKETHAISLEQSDQFLSQAGLNPHPSAETVPKQTRGLREAPHKPAFLMVVKTPQEHTYELSAEVTLIQRMDENVVGLRDDAVSRTQAIITRDQDGRYSIVDGNGTTASKNGTLVEGKQVPISSGTPLTDGDLVSIGETILRFKQ